MIKIPNILHWRSGLLRRATLLLCVIGTVITLIYTQQGSFSQIQNSHHEDINDSNNDVIYETPANSIYVHLEKYLSKSKLKKNKQLSFQSLSKIDQCILLVSESIRQFGKITSDPDDSLFLMTEQLRVYDYCFISGGLELSSVFDNLKDSTYTPIDYNQRLFPYLNSYQFVDTPMLPTIYQITKDGMQEKISFVQINDIQRFNENFWSSFLNYSTSKGIVVTMTQNDIEMFKKLLNVLKFLGNTLPIQIVTTGNDFDEDTMAILSQFVSLYNQEIYLIDCSTIINKTYIHAYITGFLNKWVATLFNTFEEIILVDIDSVPFVPPVEFFDIKQYKQSGMYMYRDREILKDGTPETCLDEFKLLLPSSKEVSLKMTNFKFALSKSNALHLMDSSKNKTTLTMEEKVFYGFFQQGKMHQVDSGLVVINRMKQLSGLLVAFTLHLSQRFEKCIHGDKEFFWLGPLVAGKDYNIDLTHAGTMGILHETEERGTGICATQIAHVNEENHLMWSNGGLNICKFKDAANKDFRINEQFFTNRYKDPESLQAIYNSPLQIDGIVIPDVDASPWMQTRECTQYRFCAYFKESKGMTSASNSDGGVIRLNSEQVEKYNKISSTWSQT